MDANNTTENDDHFDIHASIVFELGENLLTDSVQALVELVKNSYDADASYCLLDVVTAGKAGAASRHFENSDGVIIIEDDGIGMSTEVIRRGFLVISNSMKKDMKKRGQTTKLGRTPLGDKGLGRLSMQKLSENVEVFTTCENSDVEQYIGFSWNDFRSSERLTEVPVRRAQKKGDGKQGTRLVLSGLKDAEEWRGTELLDLTRELSQMVSPFKEIEDFSLLATIDGIRLDLRQVAENLRNTAQVRYFINFDGEILAVIGQLKMDYISPKQEQEREIFKALVESDNGESFLTYLATQKKGLEKFALRRSVKPDWFLEVEYKFEFKALDKAKLIDKVAANPGPFRGEVDGFDLGTMVVDQILNTYDVFNSRKEYKDAIKSMSGIRVYRDGFGVRVDRDWLGLGDQLTKGGSWYTLRPDNTIGFIALSAEQNGRLEETTDREGFRRNPYYLNFEKLLEKFVDFSDDAQSFIRRGWLDYKGFNAEKTFELPEKASSKAVANQAIGKLAKGEAIKKAVASTKAALEKKGNKESSSDLENKILKVKQTLESTEVFLQDVSGVDTHIKFLEDEIGRLKLEMAMLYEIASLGLTAEAWSHEIHNVTEGIALRNKAVGKYLKEKELRDATLSAYLEFVSNSIIALRKQIAHLSPSLRYVRDKRDSIDLELFCRELFDFYKPRFEVAGLSLTLITDERTPFVLRMNKGKLSQIFDNLLLNSEYWLKEDIRTSKIAAGLITVELKKPYIRISDNGTGFDKSIEARVFEPFVSAKSKEKGRGLGLFIVRQLLDSESSKIELLGKRNPEGNRYVLEMNFAGAEHA